MTFERDPEEIGEESYEDTELRMDVQQSIHTFDPGPDGRCQAHLIRRGVEGNVCGSTQKWSVLHDNSDDPRDRFMEGGSHWHGGGDCMCFENESWDDDEAPATLNHYTVVLKLDVLSTETHPSRWDWNLMLDLAKSEGEHVEVLGIVPS